MAQVKKLLREAGAIVQDQVADPSNRTKGYALRQAIAHGLSLLPATATNGAVVFLEPEKTVC